VLTHLILTTALGDRHFNVTILILRKAERDVVICQLLTDESRAKISAQHGYHSELPNHLLYPYIQKARISFLSPLHHSELPKNPASCVFSLTHRTCNEQALWRSDIAKCFHKVSLLKNNHQD
jgi:hypothetical protein